MTANLYGTQRIDQNGETAALIKMVTPERGFTFDGGSLGIVDTEAHNGELWVYVPRRAQRITIHHSDYGVLRNYIYPIPIEGGRTYEMLIDIGTGRYITVTSEVAAAEIYVDGQQEGLSPVRKYLNYGRHTIRAVKDRHEGGATVTITTSAGREQQVVTVPMRDMSDHYGDVTVTVDNRADIFFNGKNVGTGQWRTQLREGSYTIETRKTDCDPQQTSFTVTAQRQNNVIANAPVPHTGWLHIYTRPRNIQVTMNGTKLPDLTESMTLPVGTYQLQFSRKGYVTENHEYTVLRNVTTRDTVTLHRVTYVKPLAFYFGGALTVRSLTGVTGIVGAVYQRHDLQASYTFGLAESDAVYWGGDLNTGTKYTMNSIGVRYGYQFPLMRQLAITPQVGYSYHYLTASAAQSGNTIYGDGAAAQALSVGAKLVLVPMQHLYLFVAPEYMVTLSQDATFKNITDSSNFSADGFAVHAGVLVNF
ncbi:MAG: PEGA domain-containing protein [Prevotella sp.]|nr:PEGA domain-containing protein [Prevotella sp.]